jgi:MIP family channel proteins
MVEINTGLDDVKTLKFWRAILAEFFGTMLFLICVTTVCQPWGKPDPSANHMEIGIGIGLAIATVAMIVGHVSGGHLNPAVSLGMVLAGRISVLQGLLYIPAQLVGAICGTAITLGLTPGTVASGATTLSAGVTSAQGFGLELLFTLILVMFVFSITDPAKNVGPAPACLGIGVCIWVAHVCLIGYTGCGINPARSFGPAVIHAVWANHWVYWIGPLVGGILAAILYKCVFGHCDAEEKAPAAVV